MTNNATGIDIRKALLAKGLNPAQYDEAAILRDVNEHSISDWELGDQILHDTDRYRKSDEDIRDNAGWLKRFYGMKKGE